MNPFELLRSGKRPLLFLLWGLLLAIGWTGIIVLTMRTIRSDHQQYVGRIGADVDAQHQFLHRRLHHGDPLPIRTMLTHTFYGFSLVDTVLLAPDDAVRRARAVAELRWIVDRLDESALRARYHDTQVPHGVYYLGQHNLTLAGLLLIDSDPRETDAQEYHATSKLLFDALLESPNAHLDSYPEHVWPADNVVALYSLAVHDQLYGTRYRAAVERWVEFMSSHLDPKTNLIPFKLDHRTGSPAVMARGVTLAYSLVFLSDLAPEFARAQYDLFQENYYEWRFGLLGVREYPRGDDGPIDIDSGPIALGIGAGACGFALAAARSMEDDPAFASLILSAETLGIPMSWRKSKRYLLGYFPIVDAMIVWGKTRVSWLDPGLGRRASDQRSAPGPFTRSYLIVLLASGAGILLLATRLAVGYIRRGRQPGLC